MDANLREGGIARENCAVTSDIPKVGKNLAVAARLTFFSTVCYEIRTKQADRTDGRAVRSPPSARLNLNNCPTMAQLIVCS
jgi:hypothetical protein